MIKEVKQPEGKTKGDRMGKPRIGFEKIARLQDGTINLTCSYGGMIVDIADVLLRDKVRDDKQINIAVRKASEAVCFGHPIAGGVTLGDLNEIVEYMKERL